MRAILLALMILSVVLAGCAGETQEEPEETVPEETFDEFELDDTQEQFGVIRGVVVDTSVAPVAGARVTLTSTGQTVTTTETGAFAFKDVAAGPHFLSANKTGYSITQTSVQVAAGINKPDVTRIMIERIPGTEPRIVPDKFDGHITCSIRIPAAGFNDGCGVFGGLGLGTTQRRDYSWEEPNMEWIQLDLTWKKNSETANELCTSVGGADGQGASCGPDNLIRWIDRGGIEGDGLHKGEDFEHVTYPAHLAGGVSGNIVLEQSFEVFVHVFINFTPDEGWSFVRDEDHPNSKLTTPIVKVQDAASKAMRAILSALMLVSIVLAGCAGDTGAEPEETIPEETFDEFELEGTKEEFGVIRGVVVDGTIAPIAGAEVTLVSTGQTVVTKQNGAFGFKDLPASVYFLEVNKTGYGSTQTSVDVKAGVNDPEVTRVLIERIPGTEPQIVPLQFDGHIECSLRNPTGGFSTGCLLGLAVDEFAQDRRDFEVGSGKVHFMQTELDWVAKSDTAKRLCLRVYGYGLPDSCGETGFYQNVDQAKASEEGLGAGENIEVVVYVDHMVEGTVGIAIDQPFQAFTHVFYNWAPPEGWSFGVDGEPEP